LKQEHENERQQQELALIKKEKEVTKVTSYLYILAIISMAIFGFMYVKGMRSRFSKEREIDLLEFNRTKDILEVKNKELITAALKTVEHGELMQQLKDGAIQAA